MSKNNIERRDFLKKMGLGTFAVGVGLGIPSVIGQTKDGFLIKNETEYGETPVEILTNKKPYLTKPDVLKRMEQKMNIFSRNRWDTVRKKEMERVMKEQGGKSIFEINLIDKKGKLPNQTRLDYAFMQGAWSTAYVHPFFKWETESGAIKQHAKLGKWNPADLGMNWDEATLAVKHASTFYGASLAGAVKLNPLWVYDEFISDGKDPNEFETEQTVENKKFDPDIKYAVVLAFEEDFDGISNSPGRLASASTGDGYSRMAVTSFKVAEFIRALGYKAIPAGNGIGLSVPLAIDAGFGELGRNGLLVTPKYGPRVRLAKVYTNMPLVPDSPIRFGVKEFCEACMICAEDCPSGSISKEKQTWKGKSASNNNGALKWYVNPESCFDFNGFSCSNCKRNCPFNKPNNSWVHKLIRDGINIKSEALDKIMVTFDEASGYGKQTQSAEFWKKDGTASITAREMKD